MWGRIIPVNELAQLSCFAVSLSAAMQKLEQIMSSLEWLNLSIGMYKVKCKKIVVLILCIINIDYA